MRASRFAIAAFGLGTAAFAGGWPASMDGFRHSWKLSALSLPRQGVWESGLLSSDTARVLVRPDPLSGGEIRSMEWWAERGARDRDLPDETFWNILDGLSGNKEWTESDPDALPADFAKGMEKVPAQGFLCRSCDPQLVAATWVSHGTTRLRTGRIDAHARPAGVPGLAQGITEAGLRSLAGQKGLAIASANPCRVGDGSCTLELSGPKGQKWVFQRRSGDASWSTVEATVQAGPWWSPEWNWDSLRIESRKELANTLAEWLSADADVAARNLLGPIEPVLSFPVSAWISRTLPGLRFAALGDSLSQLAAPPPNLELVRTPTLSATIDAFGRRTIRVGK
jgi:hypothetical protein